MKSRAWPFLSFLLFAGLGSLAWAQETHIPNECPDLRGTYSCSFFDSSGDLLTEKIRVDQQLTSGGVLYLLHPQLDYDSLEANGLTQKGEELLQDNDLLLQSRWERTLSCRDNKLYTKMRYIDFVEGELIGYSQLHFSVEPTKEGLHIEGHSLWQDPEGQVILKENFSETCPRLESK